MEFITMSFAEIIALQNIVNKDEEEEPKKAPEPSAEEKLLTEIRDLLKAQQEK